MKKKAYGYTDVSKDMCCHRCDEETGVVTGVKKKAYVFTDVSKGMCCH